MWPEIVLGLAVALQSALLLLVWWRLREVRQAVAVIARSLPHGYTDVPTSVLVGMLGRLETRLGQLDQRPASSGPAYALAQQLAQEGASIEQLIERCGLSRDEAKLISRLHHAGH